jgi:CRP-like cAMP-binding protein
VTASERPRDDILDRLAQLALFGDLTHAQLQAVAHRYDEHVFGTGERVLRRGLSGTGFHVILEGEASVLLDGQERARLGRGDFFGEMSALTREPAAADVVAVTMLRCFVIPSSELVPFLLERPRVMLRMLEAEVRRVARANLWQG